MKHAPLFVLAGLAALMLSSCSTVSKTPYQAKAYAPTNPDNVKVKVSLKNMMAYVIEDNKALLVTPVAIGTPENPTPKGTFKVFQKIPQKRSNTYGFHVAGNEIRPGTSAKTPPGSKYVGYPMPYWIEFLPGYGIHKGCVWPVARTHGCLRVHENVAPKFYALVKEGTTIHIADTQPEDATIGAKVERPTDYADPDPPASLMISAQAFPQPAGPLFEPGPAPLIF